VRDKTSHRGSHAAGGPAFVPCAGLAYRLYRLKPRVSRSKGASNKLVCRESMAGIWSL